MPGSHSLGSDSRQGGTIFWHCPQNRLSLGSGGHPLPPQTFFSLCMRKIESQMIAALKGNINWTSANTAVVFENDEKNTSTVYLHGNKIAELDEDSLTVFDGGYQSKTTKSRLNVLINEFCNAITDGIFQENFQWFVRDNNEVKKFTGSYTFA